MQKDSKRLFILSRSEIQKLYDFPIFNIAEQHEYFTMNAQERKVEGLALSSSYSAQMASFVWILIEELLLYKEVYKNCWFNY